MRKTGLLRQAESVPRGLPIADRAAKAESAPVSIEERTAGQLVLTGRFSTK